MENLQTKVAFITGGTKGIGNGIAEAMMKEGIKVAITSRSLKSAEEAADKLNSKSSNAAKALGLEADVRDFESQKRAFDKAVEKFGKVDIIIANAGVGHFAPVDEMSVQMWEEILETNLSGPFFTLKAGVEQLKKNKGYFISISSLAGTNFFAGGSAYNASKFGVTGFTQAAMLDLRGYGIKVSTIMPGSVATHFNDNEPGEKDSWKIQKEDIGKLVVDLLKMNPRALPSKVEIRPTTPPSK